MALSEVIQAQQLGPIEHRECSVHPINFMSHTPCESNLELVATTPNVSRNDRSHDANVGRENKKLQVLDWAADSYPRDPVNFLCLTEVALYVDRLSSTK